MLHRIRLNMLLIGNHHYVCIQSYKMCVVSVLVWFWKDLWIMQSNTKCMYYSSLQTDTVLPAYISADSMGAIAPTANNQNVIIFVPTGVSLANFPQNPSWIYGEQKGGGREVRGKKEMGE